MTADYDWPWHGDSEASAVEDTLRPQTNFRIERPEAELRLRFLFPGVLLILIGAVALFIWRDDLFDGESLPGIQFHSAEIEGLPPYPGGTQVSGILTLEVPTAIREYIGEEGSSWVAYRTGDALEDIIFYYQREMERHGYAQVQSGVMNAMHWRSSTQKYAVYVAVDRIQNLVILGTAPG